MILTAETIPKSESLVPGQVYQRDASGALLVPLVQQIYTSYADHLRLSNSNHVIFWHNICIALTANVDSFEIGAGREGREVALAALDDISAWAETPAAQRACLHAAQVYLCMSNKKPIDGTSFLSEAALFNAALVLGLYLLVSPTSLREPTMFVGGKPFELLDDVDWAKLGDEGLRGSNTSGAPVETAVARFIRTGGKVSFAGVVHGGGFSSSRKVILEYVGLLEEVGKWKVGEFTRILRTLSDSPVNLDV